MKTHNDLQCPKCKEWVEILPSTPAVFDCPWCGEPLTIQDGKLVSALPHIKRMLKHAKDYEPEQAYGTADDFRKHQQYGGTRDDY